MSKEYTLDGRSFTLDDGLSDNEALSVIQNFLASEPEQDTIDTYGRAGVAEREAAAQKELDAMYEEDQTVAQEVDEGGFFDQITPDAVEELIKGTIGGAAGLVESGLLGAATVLPEDYELAVRKGIQSVGDLGEKYIYGADKGSEDMVTRKFGEGLGSFAGIAGASLLNPFLGASLAVGAGAGEASERARASGATSGERAGASALGAIVGASELISPLRMIKMLKTGYGDEASEAILNKIGRVVREGGIEAGQEAAAGIAQNAIEKNIYNPDQEYLEGTGEQATYGGAVGAFVQAILETALIPKSRRDKFATEDKRQTDIFPTTKEKLGVAPEKDFEETVEKTPEEKNVEELEAARTDERQTAFNLEEPVISTTEAPEAIKTERLDAAQTDDGSKIATKEDIDPFAKDPNEKIEDRLPDITEETLEDIIANNPNDKVIQEVAKKALEAKRLTKVQEVSAEVVKTPKAPANLTVENTKSWGDLLNKARTEATKINKRDSTNIKSGNVLADMNLPMTKAEYDQQKTPVAEAPTDQGTQTDFFSEEAPVAEAPVAEAPVAEVPVAEAPVAEAPVAEAPITKDVTPAPVEGTYEDIVLTNKEKKMIASGEANIQKTIDAERELYKGTTVKFSQQLGGRVTTVSDGKKDIHFVRDAADDNFYRTSADGMKILNFDGQDFGKSGKTPLPIASNKVEAEKTIIKELKSVKPDKKKKKKSTAFDAIKNVITIKKKKSTPSDTKPGKLIAKKTVQDATIARKESAEKRSESALDKGVRTAKIAKDKRTAKKKLEDEINVYKSFAVRTKLGIPAQEKKFAEQEAAGLTVETSDIEYTKQGKRIKSEKREVVEGAPRITPVAARKEALKLDFYTAPYPKSRVQSAFSVEDTNKILNLLQRKHKQTKLDYPTRDSSGASAAYNYFVKQEDPVDTLDNIVYDMIFTVKEEIAGGKVKGKEKLFDKDIYEAGETIFSDSTYRSKNTESKAANVYFSQTGSQNARLAAKWIRDNLSVKQKQNLNKLITEYAQDASSDVFNENKIDLDIIGNEQSDLQKQINAEEAKGQVPTKDKKRNKNLYENYATVEAKRVESLNRLSEFANVSEDTAGSEIDVEDINEAAVDAVTTLYLNADSVKGLDLPMHPSIKSLLGKGQLQQSLEVLARTSLSGRVGQIANALSEVVGDTKVEVVDFLTNESNTQVSGLFDPKTNTIKIDKETGLNPHTILHEMTHAATSSTIQNKSNPLTKQLNTIYESVKDSLDSVYGSQSLNEFAAEAFSNPVFQKKLARMHPDGSPISALQRFFNVVGNFVRRMLNMQPKSIESALNKSDRIIQGMLAPSPNSRNADVLLLNATADGVKRMMKGIGDRAKRIPKMDSKARKQFGIDVKEFFQSDIKEGAKALLLQLTDTKGLAEIAQANGFGKLGFELDEGIELQRAEQLNSDAEVKEALIKITTWTKNNKEKEVALDNIIYSSEYGATIHQVDPTLTIVQAAEKYGKDSEKMAVWQKQREHWKTLGAGKGNGQEIYLFMRDHYKKQYLKLKKVIFGEIDAALLSDEKIADLTKNMGAKDKEAAIAEAKEQAGKLKNDVFTKLFNDATLDVYFPLTRQGKYKLTYSPTNSKNPRDAFIVRMFDSREERNDAETEVKEARDSDGKPTYVKDSIEISDGDVSKKSFERSASGSFVRDVVDTLKRNDVNPEVQNQIMKLFIDTLPESSFAKSLQPRKGFEGYQGNAVAAFRSKAYGLGRQTARLKYSSIIRGIENKISAVSEPVVPDKKLSLKTASDKTATLFKASFNKTKAELEKRGEFARQGSDNKLEPLAKLANQIAFIYTIGTNPSSAAVNLSQIPLFVYPYLGASYGYKQAQQTITRSSYIVTSSNLSIDKYYDIKQVKNKDGIGVSEFTVKTDVPEQFKKELAELAPMVQRASELGLLSKSSLIAEAMGLDESGIQFEGGGIKKKAGRLLDRIAAGSAVFFNGAERFNRQVTLISTYKLALDKLNSTDTNKFYDSVENKTLTKQEIADLSVEQKQALAVRESIFQTQRTNGGTSLESAPRVAQQGLGRVAWMYKSFGLNMYFTMLRTTKLMLDGEADPDVRKTAFKQVVGIHGSALFFAGVHGLPLYGLFTAMADMMLDDDEEDADTIVRKAITEGWYKGAVNAITGLDIANRVKLTDLIIQSNKFNTNPTAEEFMYDTLLGPAGSVAKRFGRGINDMLDGEVERGFESLMPSGITNAYKVTLGRYQREGGIYTRRGDPIYDDMSGYEMAAQGLGFAPVGYTLNQEKNQMAKGIERSITDRKSKLLKKYYLSLRFGESPDDILQEIIKFNKKHPSIAISMSSVRRSIKMHMKTSALMHNGVTINPKLRQAIKDSISEYSN